MLDITNHLLLYFVYTYVLTNHQSDLEFRMFEQNQSCTFTFSYKKRAAPLLFSSYLCSLLCVSARLYLQK
uniref:Uncharacterized protein n=1 Tax=Anguilla anguilla TaxID=7936 RepID=A0A0E9XD55_ANGAN